MHLTECASLRETIQHCLAQATLLQELNHHSPKRAKGKLGSPFPIIFAVPAKPRRYTQCECWRQAKNRLPLQKAKTYNRRDSQMVTHSSTSRPVQCLCMAERTGCPVLTDLWSYVLAN